MENTKNLSDVEIVRNSRYEILSDNNEFKPFSGVMKGYSSDLYEWAGQIVTGGHTVLINNKWTKVSELPDAKKVTHLTNKLVYDIVDVKDTHSFKSGNYIHHNCQTGQGIVSILDTKTNKKIKLTLAELEKLIILDNAGIEADPATTVVI